MAISLASVVFRHNVLARSQFGEDRRLSHLPDRERLGQRGDARRRQLDRARGREIVSTRFAGEVSS